MTVTQVITRPVTGVNSQGSTTTGNQQETVVVVVTAGRAGTMTATEGDAVGPVVTITATNPGATGGSDGGLVVVTVTQSDPTTDAEGQQSFVIATKTTRVRLTYVVGTETQTAEGSLQTDNAAGRLEYGPWAWAAGVGLGGAILGALAI